LVLASAGYLKVYCENNPNDADELYRLAAMYRMLGKDSDALYYYNKVIELHTPRTILTKAYVEFIGDDKRKFISTYEKYPLARFYRGQMLKHLGRYKEALNDFGLYMSCGEGYYRESDCSFYYKLASKEAEGCWFALNEIYHPPKVEIQWMEQNKGQSYLYAPVFVNDSTIFFNRFQYLYFINKGPIVQKYDLEAAKRQKGHWVNAGPPLERNKDVNEFTATLTFSADRKHVYFHRCDVKYNFYARQHSIFQTYVDDCALYVADYNNGVISNARKLNKDINLAGYRNIMPSIGTDSLKREVLYFSSDRPGGQGGMDIWYATYNKRTKDFDTAVNAGNIINTISDEITPFYEKDSGYLYFSSDGWAGLGGMDVFCSKGSPDHWSRPENLRLFNTKDNETYFIIHPDHHYGFFSRPWCRDNECGPFPPVRPEYSIYRPEDLEMLSRHKYISDDIDHCERLFSFFIPYKHFAVSAFAADATDTLHQYMNDVTVKMYGPYLMDTMVQRAGKKFFQIIRPERTYVIHFSKPGFQDQELLFSTDTLTHPDTLSFRADMVPLPPEPKTIVIRNIIFEFDKDELNETSKAVLDTTLFKFLELNPTKRVMVLSHSDGKGDADYNLQLSQRRAESIVRYLVKKGIDPRRLVPKGYGSQHPIAPETNKDGSDNPTGREMNRRTEFRVIGEVK
jgi:outer membrane protein OmpA-like peptidoglycan-associated protein